MRTVLKYISIRFTGIFCAASTHAQQIIISIAGTGITEYIGDGSPATAFSLGLPKSICIDKKGMIYEADNANNRIRTLYRDTLRTFIGSLTEGETGDGGMADTATLRMPVGVCLDTAGNLYITEWYNSVIRKVDAHTGIISTICGVIGGGFGGDGGPATDALLLNPGAACTDIAGNLYIPDNGNHRIRKVSAATGHISTIAGTGTNGYSGDGGPATDALLSYPSGICTDTAGNVYFAEQGNHTIRKIDAISGNISTIAGTGAPGYSGDGGPAVNATLDAPNSVFIDKHGYIYISDFYNDVIRAIMPSGDIYTIAGTGFYGYSGDGGHPKNATFRGPAAVCTDDSGHIYIADGFNSVIRKMTPIDTSITGINDAVAADVHIYPNPAKDVLHIFVKGLNADDMQIVLCDMAGRQITITPRKDQNGFTIPVGSLANGLYLLRLQTRSEVIVRKIEVLK